LSIFFREKGGLNMVNETVLSRMVKDFGDYVMRVIMEDLYGSGMAQLVILIGGTIAFVSLGFSLHKGESPRRATVFFVAWLCCLPVGGKPLAFGLVNGLGTSLAYQLQKTSLKVLEGPGGTRAMPPGWLMNTLLRANGAEISDPALQDDLSTVLSSCIPDVLNLEGEPMTAADLFGGKVRNGRARGEIYEERFDPLPLRARRLIVRGREVSCYDLLVDSRSRLRQHIEQKSIARTDERNYLAVSSGDVSEPKKLKTSWPDPNTREAERVKSVALNLATAAAIQKTAMGIGGESEHFWQSRGNFIDSRINRSTDAAVSGHFEAGQDGAGNWLTRATFDLMSAPTAIARALNIDGAIKSGLILQELNEKLLSLPYYVAFIQSLLKILVPVAALSMLVGTFKLFFMCASVWWVTLIIPVVMQFSRGISNSILFHMNKIGETARVLDTEPGYLANAVSFEAASKIVEDSSRLMNVILNVELGIWVALLALIPAGAWFAGGIANRMSATMADALVSGIVRGATIKFGGAVFGKGSTLLSSAGKVGTHFMRSGGTHARQTVSLAHTQGSPGGRSGSPLGGSTSKPILKAQDASQSNGSLQG
jgi:hypothetical protein